MNQRATNDITKKRNYCTKLSENVELKHQEELYGGDENRSF